MSEPTPRRRRPALRPWAVAVRALAVPLWYPFALLAWLGEKSERLFWWIERVLPHAERRPPP